MFSPSPARSIMILFHLFSAISTRARWGIDSSESVYSAFAGMFCLEEYNNISSELISFCDKMFKTLLTQHLFYDMNVAQVYLSLILFILGHDD